MSPTDDCVPPNLNRAERRARRGREHEWKTGSPEDGQFCAVCGKRRLTPAQP